MAVNVFGTPITDATLRQIPPWNDGREIKRVDRAKLALDKKDEEGKKDELVSYIDKLKEESGAGISTYCMIYNATGDPINFITEHDWHNSHLGPGPYPTRIANGQWGGFLHVKQSGTATGSHGAVVYRAKDNADNICDFMAAWTIPYIGTNSAYTEVHDSDYFAANEVWDYIETKLYNSGRATTYTWKGCFSSVNIEDGTTAKFEAIFQLN